MKFKRMFYLLGALLIFFNNGLVSARTPAVLSGGCVRVVESSPLETTLEVQVDDFQVETVDVGGQTYQRWLIPGMSQNATPGEFQVPTCGALIGLAFPEGASVQVLETDFETFNGVRMAPVTSYDVSAANLDSSEPVLLQETVVEMVGKDASPGFLPGDLAMIGQSGYLREQAFAQVQFYPIQYNPASNQVRLYRRLLARVSVAAGRQSASRQTRYDSPAYEKVLKSAILNYEALGRQALSFDQNVPASAVQAPAAVESAGQALKIGVEADGMYRLTYDQLVAAGYSFAGVNAHTLKILNRGTEIPIQVVGEGDNQFGPGDSILFYGVANSDLYTITNVYWLSDGGTLGLRMPPRSRPPGGATLATAFPAHIHAEEDTVYWQSMPNGEGLDHWFWGDKFGSLMMPISRTREITLTLENISTNPPSLNASLKVRLKGYSSIFTVDPDHKTSLSINDQQIHPGQVWDGFAVFDVETTFLQSLLQEGDNIITVEAVTPDQAPSVDLYYLNWIELNYWDTYVAENNELPFGAPGAGTYRFSISNFTSNEIQVFDITDPANVSQITDGVISGASPFQIAFQDTATLDTRYLALTPSRYKTSASLELDQPSNWKEATNGADYIIVTHLDYLSSAQVLADYHSAPDLRVVVVDVEDIYDEFNDGIFNPQAIRDFFSYAYNSWTLPAPTYALLLGEATYDYRDLLPIQVTRSNDVPSHIVETLSGEFPSDNWFVSVHGDDILPELFISRLPADSPSEAAAMVDKIIDYDQTPPDASWNRNALLIADSGEDHFRTINDQIASTLPADFTKNKIYAGQYPGNITQGITDNINQGSLFTNYAGHGNPQQWASYFSDVNITALNNTDKLTIVTVADCLSGFFTGMANPSSAEAFLQLPDKGAVAVWAPSALGDMSGQRQLIGNFYNLLYRRGVSGLGEATTTAKINIYSQNGSWGELVETYILFGDPLTQVEVPDWLYLPLLKK